MEEMSLSLQSPLGQSLGTYGFFLQSRVAWYRQTSMAFFPLSSEELAEL